MLSIKSQLLPDLDACSDQKQCHRICEIIQIPPLRLPRGYDWMGHDKGNLVSYILVIDDYAQHPLADPIIANIDIRYRVNDDLHIKMGYVALWHDYLWGYIITPLTGGGSQPHWHETYNVKINSTQTLWDRINQLESSGKKWMVITRAIGWTQKVASRKDIVEIAYRHCLLTSNQIASDRTIAQP